MTDPTPLSPAAQAVLAAAINDTADIINKPHCDWIQGYSRQIAAALRAAADQVEHHWDGMECVDHLQVIAAELEGADG